MASDITLKTSVRLCSSAVAIMIVQPFHAALAEPADGVTVQQDSVTVQQLEEELAKRDAVIVDLLHRVRALEEKTGSPGGARTRLAGQPNEQAATVPRSPGAASGAPPAAASAAPPAAASAGRPPASSAASPAASSPASPAAENADDGRQIDRLQAERALERSLVQEGVRLLNPGRIELAPGFMLYRYEGDFPTVLMSGDEDVVGEREHAFDVYDSRADLRIGLPWRSQLELGVPYRRVDERIKLGIDGVVQSVEDQSGSGLGDVTLGFAHSLMAEGSGRPNLIGRVLWLSGSGKASDGGVSLGGGMSGAAAQLSAYWRRDPVVFLLSGGYTHYFEDGGTHPGDDFDASLGMALAVSPETALTFALDQTWARAFERDGVELPGTDRLSSSLRLSASTILGRRLFLLVNASAGLTGDAPDYGFGISLSSHFAGK